MLRDEQYADAHNIQPSCWRLIGVVNAASVLHPQSFVGPINVLNHLLNVAAGLGNLIDLPASSLRDLLGGHNAIDQWTTPFSSENRLSGRDLLRHHGIVGPEDTWTNFGAGLATELLTDPLNLLGVGALRNALRARHAVAAENAGIRSANALSRSQRAMGFFPEELISLQHPSNIVRETGLPVRQYHGTNAVFERFDPLKDSGENLYGKGFYHTDNPHVASEYVDKELANAVYPEAPDVLRRHLATLAAGSTEHQAVSQALNRVTHPWIPPFHDDVVADLSHAQVPHDILSQVVGPSPLNVRSAYIDSRNPLNITSGRTPLSLLPEDIRNRVSFLPRSDVRAALNDLRVARRHNMVPMLPEAERRVSEAFRNRGLIQNEKLFDKYAVPEIDPLAFGHDTLVHVGGKITGTQPHNVTIALDPSQVYKPYVAAAIKPEKRLPSARRATLGLGVTTGARLGRKQ